MINTDITLGSGVSGKVKTKKSKSHGLIAVKQYEPKQSHETMEDYKFRVTNEYNQLFKLSSPSSHVNIVDVFKCHKSWFGTSYCLHMELCSKMTLKKMIYNELIVDESELLCVIKQLCNGLDYLHNHHQICHRDLKLDNLIIGRDGYLKLIDFVDSRSTNQLCVGLVGTEIYVAPEVFTHLKYDGEKTDIWSLGIIIHFLLTKKFPWKSANTVAFKTGDNSNDHIDQLITNDIDPNARQVILNCLTVDPKCRWNISQFAANFWYQKINYCHPANWCGIDHKRLYELSYSL